MDLRDLPMSHREGPPFGLRLLGWLAMAAIIGTTFVTEPTPGPDGDGPFVALGLLLLIAGLAVSLPRRELPPGQRVAGLVLLGASSSVLAAFQPDGAGFAGIYFVMVIGGMRLPLRIALIVCGGALTALVAVLAFADNNPGAIVGLLFSVIPWFLVMRLIRRVAYRRDQAEALVVELKESRAAHAEAAAQAERARVARDLHDVLAHSLSALALQLEGTRLLARDRGADDELVEGLGRAHHLAVAGLAEARQAIAALRGDDLPDLADLAGGFPGASFNVTGTPREPSSEARLALYRTAQEALTNIRRHSASDRVELRLDYADDGTTLTVQDHGVAPPIINGAHGYGLTGMRERAELLGGRLDAGPTNDGFRVELWLPG
ncbi:MAG TPA: histidine kinase [Solirubrobacter sp.]|nr:histidine kinase [Solirubrobacter sp.]